MTIEIEGLRRALGLSRAQAMALVGVASEVARASGAPRARTQRLLEVASESLVGELPATPPVSPAVLRGLFPDERQRRAVIDALIVVVCIEGEVDMKRRASLRALASAVGVRSPFVDLLGDLASGRLLTIKRALATRSPDARRLLSRVWREEGVLGLLRAAWFAAGRHRDPSLAARFRALETLPEGTLGRSFFEHIVRRGLSFPGEAGGVPERMVHHDLLHVLNGFDTDPAGECELAGFYAAFTEGEPFTFIMTVLATFHLGLRVSPEAVVPGRLAFDPERVLAAFLRGRRLAVDVMGFWDYWALMPLPIDEARGRLGLAPGGGVSSRPSLGAPA